MAHSRWGGSAIYILDKCLGALRMQANAPEEDEGEPAKIGTACHEAGQFALEVGCSAYDLVGQEFYGVMFTDSMAADVQLYVSEVNKIKAMYPDAVVLVEKKVTMFSVSPDVFGYTDVSIYVPSLRLLIIGDYKNGFGVVEASTLQLKHYIVSFLDTYNLWDGVDRIEGFICQPNGSHIDGETRYVQYTIADAVAAQARFREIYHGSLAADALLTAGEHCKWCKARATCRVRMYRTLDLLYPDAPLETLSPGEILEIFKELSTMKSQLEKVDELANTLAKAGNRLEGYKLVKSIARHVCEDEEGFVKAVLTNERTKITDKSALYNAPRLKGKTALKEIRGVPKDLVDKYFKPPAEIGTDLVPNSDPRPAVGKGSGLGVFPPVQIFDSVE